jgi:hypothetical protein
MLSLIKKISSEFPSLTINQSEVDNGDSAIRNRIRYTLEGFEGNANVSISVSHEDKLKRLYEILKKKPVFLDEFVGVNIEGVYYIALLRNGTRRALYFSVIFGKIELLLPYFGQNLKISILEDDELDFAFLTTVIRGVRHRQPLFLKLENYSAPHKSTSSDLREILNSVLFDLEYNFLLPLLPFEYSSSEIRVPTFRKHKGKPPTEGIIFTFKKYIPELLQYYNLAESVTNLPFKFLCYYHILEYFSDKSTYSDARRKIKQYILKPDFNLNPDFYISEMMNLFKGKNDQNYSDKVKLNKTLKEYILKEEISSYLEATNLKDHFVLNETIFQCIKPLPISKLEVMDDNRFFETLTSRIYSVRCSTVHSNPEYDEKKAVPFLHTAENIALLNFEIALLSEIARTIIIKSAEF